MAHLIDKDALVAEIERIRNLVGDGKFLSEYESGCRDKTLDICNDLLSFLDTLEVKEVEDDSLEKFKSLQHVSGDLKSTLHYLGYAPNLYHFDGSWHVDWISCEEGDSIKCFTADTAKEAINEAYNWFHSTFCNG